MSTAPACGDALVEACCRLTGADVLPESHGEPTRLTVTIGYDHLKDSLGEGIADTGERLSAAAVRRLACHADLLPVVLGTNSQILDVGRTHRLVTHALWNALVARDHGCAFPAAAARPSPATPTTSPTGPTAEALHWPTWCSTAAPTTP